MSRFRSIGRIATARGNSLWARNFNTNLKFGFHSSINSHVMSPSAWRVLAAGQTAALSRISTFALAAELPVGCGYAEQFRDTNPHTMSAPEDSGSEELMEEAEIGAAVETANEMNIQSCGGSSKTCWLGLSSHRK